jgi:hypothetical protein
VMNNATYAEKYNITCNKLDMNVLAYKVRVVC